MFPFLWQASEALAAAGLPAAVRRALKFEKELADLSREGLQPKVAAPAVVTSMSFLFKSSFPFLTLYLFSQVLYQADCVFFGVGHRGTVEALSELHRAQKLASVRGFTAYFDVLLS